MGATQSRQYRQLVQAAAIASWRTGSQSSKGKTQTKSHDLPSLRKIVTSEMVSEILCFFLKSILVSWDALRVRTWGPSPPRIRSYDSGCAAALIEQQTSNPAEPKIAREPSRPTDIPPKNQVQFTVPMRHGLLEKRSSLRWCHNRAPYIH